MTNSNTRKSVSSPILNIEKRFQNKGRFPLSRNFYVRTHYVNKIEGLSGRSRVNVKFELLRLQATFHEYAAKHVNIARQWKSTFGDKTSRV